jgi:hypothetical protein
MYPLSGSGPSGDFAKKPNYRCDKAKRERKNSNDFNRTIVRPATRRLNGDFFSGFSVES